MASEMKQRIKKRKMKKPLRTKEGFLEEFVYPLTIEEFKNQYWGKKVFFSSMSPEYFLDLQDKFFIVSEEGDDGCGGEGGEGGAGINIPALLRECRNDDNTKLTPSTIQELETELLDSKKTINQPFCCSPGCQEIRNDFLEKMPGYGNDVEVGVYLSETPALSSGAGDVKSGSGITEWHFDNNHNFTVQLMGAKEWQWRPPCQENLACNDSRSRQDVERRPRNGNEMLHLQEQAEGNETFLLQAGAVLYIPPGFWHAVTAVDCTQSYSMDLRVGNVMHSKWIAEAVYASLLNEFHSAVAAASTKSSSQLLSARSMGPSDFTDGTSQLLQEQISFAKENMEGMLDSCRIPRALPGQTERTNGLHRGADFDFLTRALGTSTLRGDLPAALAPAGSHHQQQQYFFSVNPMVCLRTKKTVFGMALEIYSESGLSKMEYAWYTIFLNGDVFCPALEAALKLLVESQTSSSSSALKGHTFEEFLGKVSSGSMMSRRNETQLEEEDQSSEQDTVIYTLLEVLTYANILCPKLVSKTSAKSSTTVDERASKRQRRE